MSRHAKLMPPSGAARWMVCAGAPALEELYPDEASEIADEGTAAHFVAAVCIVDAVHPVTYLGKKVVVGVDWTEDGAVERAEWEDAVDPLTFDVRRTFELHADFVAPLNTYVQDILAASDGKDVYVEYQLDMSELTGEEGAVGTSDAILLDDLAGVLEVRDLKFGYVKVKANSPQLKLYALAALREFDPHGSRFSEIHLYIHQPRVFQRPDVFVMQADELRAFADEVAARGKDVHLAYEFRANWLPGGIAEGRQYLVPSDAGCEYCRAKAECPALLQLTVATITDDYVDLTQELAPQLQAAIARPMDNATLARVRRSVDMIEGFCKAVKARVHALLSQGEKLPGWKLVDGRLGNREWADAAQAEAALKSMKLRDDEMYKRTLISPTAAERIFGEKGSAPSTKRWNKLESMISRAPGKPTVAPDEDPREDQTPEAGGDFDDLTQTPNEPDDGSDLA